MIERRFEMRTSHDLGEPFSVSAAAAARLANGRITCWSDYWSISTFKRQVGFEWMCAHEQRRKHAKTGRIRAAWP